MSYYKYQKLSDHIYRIIEANDVCCYLVIGSHKAALLDSCCGYGNIKEYVKTLTEKEVILILSHGHHDHMGGSALFDEVYMNKNDDDVFVKFGNMDNRIEWKNSSPKTKDIPISDLVPTRDISLIRDIKDGDTFDLGDITIKMILVQGHTQGMMCPLIVEERTIIFGDACGVSVLLFDEFSSNVSDYRKSLLHLKEYEDQYDLIYRNHGTYESKKELLNNVIECCNLILEGKDDHVPVKMLNQELYAAKLSNQYGRADGKEGNILYLESKVK